MAGLEMPNDGEEQQDNKLADDPISRAISGTLGEEGEDIDPESGDEGSGEEDGKQQQDAGQDSSGGDKNDNKQQAPDGKGKKDKEQAGTTNNGDLRLADGTVVKGGAERRHYEKARLFEQQLSMAKNELQQANNSRQQLQNELNTLKQTVQQVQGADPAHVATGVKLVRDLSRDPVGTLKTLLTEAIGAGYTIDGIAAGIDAAAIRQSLEAKLQPYIDAAQQQQQAQQTDQEIEQEVGQFFAQYPDARLHDELIAGVMQKNPQLSMTEAYYQLKLAVVDRGLDWSQPLVPQMQAGEQQQQSPQQQQQKPMPNGRTPANATQATPADKIPVAHESTDMSSIVKQAMRESGLKI